jgi:oxygen-independent coproporphyrinogen-3 oxidase
MPIIGKDLSLYFHIPFCKKKCPYCQFYSIYHTEALENLYLQAIKKHLDIYKSVIKENNIMSIYFGGGTPSLLKIKSIEEILTIINPKKNIEITLEINPEDITKEKIKAYKNLKINRISIGVQSFDDKLLELLKRRHNSKKAKDIIFDFFSNGIENISIDLMYDIIKQDLLSWQNTLKEIKNLPIKHISLYNLTFEKNTLFYKNKKKLLKFLPKEKESLEILQLAILEFNKIGFQRYEISAFAKFGYNSIHNTGYWLGRDFLGFGPSAFSYFEKKRFQNVSNLKKYFNFLKNNLSPISFEEKLKFPKNTNELLAINLRLIDGVDICDFEKKFGKIPTHSMQVLKHSDFVILKNNKIKLSDKGLLFYDTLASEII